jgi:hypothetical protein
VTPPAARRSTAIAHVAALSLDQPSLDRWHKTWSTVEKRRGAPMASAHPITDHEEIRQWAEARGAQPACVKGTGRRGDTGMIRLDLPGFSGAKSLQPISWDDWFRQFDDNNLALLVQDTTAGGSQSNFNKLVARGPQPKGQPARSGGSARTRKTARARTRKSGGMAGGGRSTGARKTKNTRKNSGKGGRRRTGASASSGRRRPASTGSRGRTARTSSRKSGRATKRR